MNNDYPQAWIVRREDDHFVLAGDVLVDGQQVSLRCTTLAMKCTNGHEDWRRGHVIKLDGVWLYYSPPFSLPLVDGMAMVRVYETATVFGGR